MGKGNSVLDLMMKGYKIETDETLSHDTALKIAKEMREEGYYARIRRSIGYYNGCYCVWAKKKD